MECGLALRDGDKGGSEAKKRGEGGEKRRGKKAEKKTNSPALFIAL